MHLFKIGTAPVSRSPVSHPAFSRGVILLAAGLSVAACGRMESLAPVPGAVLVQLRADASIDQRERLDVVLKSHGLNTADVILDGQIIRLQGPPSEFGNESELAREIAATGAADFAEPDAMVPLARTPNDPSFSTQWHHRRIRSELAWDRTTGSSAVRVGLCDSGFDVNHPDLRQNLSLPGYDVTTGGSAVAGHPHGTMTAGALAARGGNGVGVTGAAWSSAIIPIKVSGSRDGTASYSALARCLEIAADWRARVISVSYGGLYASSAIDSAAAYARSRGALVVLAAGNDSASLNSYANSSNYLMVAASDQSDRLASFSNWGRPVDLGAPGTSIFTTTPGGGYQAADGTSFSTPIVAGVAALLFAANPNLSPAQVERILLSTASRVSEYFGYGLVDAGAALSQARSL